jgi:hypothetical protein
MNANLHPPTREIYARITGVDGNTYVSSHLVWDANKFIEAQQKAAADANAKQPAGQPRKAKAEQITEDQYLKERTK